MIDKIFTLPDKPFPTEAKFSARLWRQIHDEWWAWYKISDMSADNKPCDHIFWLKWVCWWLEVKIWDEKQRVNIHSKLRPNQIFFLKRYQDNWWLALVWYYNKFYNRFFVMQYSPNLSYQIISSKSWPLLQPVSSSSLPYLRATSS